jgi:DNA repair ATPase RecN
MALKLQEQTQVVTKLLRDQKVDFETVAAARDGLSGVASGLAAFGTTLDGAHLEKLAKGLGVTADFLDKELLPAADKASAQLDKATAALEKHTREVAKLLEALPVDATSLKDVHDNLAQFGKGLDGVKSTLQVERLKTLRDGFDGMYTALATGADQVERLASYTYPVITFNGLKPEIDRKQFWPEGDEIAGGLRKAGKGVKAAQEQIADVVKHLPELHDSLAASQKMIEGTRKSLDYAMKQHARVEPSLKKLPQQAAQLAEDLPRLGQDLTAVLKETARFRDVATALRKAQQELESSARVWPKLQKTVHASASLLQAASQQLDDALEQQGDYDKALERSITVGDGVAALVPVLTEEMLLQLDEQERSLDGLGESLGEVGSIMSGYSVTGGELVDTARLLVWLMAVLVALHCCYLLTGLKTTRLPGPQEAKP